MSSRSPKLPQWADKVGQLRMRLDLSQSELGARLHYSAMAVSRWERGALEPTADVYIRLGNLAGEPDCWFFWDRAGLKKSDLLRIVPEVSRQIMPTPHPVEIVAANGRAKVPSKIPRLFAIPLLDISASASVDDGDRVTDFSRIPALELLAVSYDWCPNPSFTACLKVHGNSMAPLIRNGNILAFDYSQIYADGLNGKIVLASHKRHGLTVARLRKFKGVEILEPENHDHEPIQISNDRNWKIVGKALWWIHRAP